MPFSFPFNRAFRLFGLLSMVLGLASCSGISTSFNPATDSQETSFYSTDREQQIGAAVAQEIEKTFKVVDDVDMNERVDRITAKIAAASDRKELVYVAKVIEPKDPRGGEEDTVNAVSLPGGYIYVFKGLMDYIKTDDQLAAVIAHEIAHVAARHSIKHLEASYSNIVAVIAAMQVDGRLAGGINAATTAMFFNYSQEDELQADRLGIKYMAAAGYDPQGMVKMLEALQVYDRKQPIRPKMYGRTHPYVYQRIAEANRVITHDLTFRDYIRITGEREEYKK